jgi:NADH:ubiquinone oxidoreductase subunit F (NADH-binding)
MLIVSIKGKYRKLRLKPPFLANVVLIGYLVMVANGNTVAVTLTICCCGGCSNCFVRKGTQPR